MQVMGDLTRGMSQGRVSFKTQQLSPAYKNWNSKQRSWTRANKEIMSRRNKECNPSACYESLDMPVHTMEFLCRSWSPAASNFLHAFSSPNSQNLDVDNKHGLGRHGEAKVDHDSDLGVEEGIAPFQVEQAKALASYKSSASHENNIWTRTFLAERCIPSIIKSSTSLDIVNKRIKEWLRKKTLTEMFMKWRGGGDKKKKKEEARLLTAKIHAALSVAQLAAAIAGFAASNSMEISNDIHTEEMKKNNVVAYAAALLASACAEAAESVGATKAHVASAVNSGLAAHSPSDMITLTASAATSLRGAETLKSRGMSGLPLSKIEKPVKLAAKLSIIDPSGQKLQRLVSIHVKHKQLMLRLEKKYLGVIITSKEYAILQVIRENKAQGYYILSIKCNSGYIKLLFEEKEQSLVWISSISSFLQMYSSCHV